jgi:hypothetical protein
MVAAHSRQQWRDCSPRLATPPTAGRSNRLADFELIASALGFELMPWQKRVIEVATEYDIDTGVPYYREIIVTVPRQSGKTLLILVWMLHRALLWGSGRPQFIAYTAQDGQSARQKLIEDHMPIVERSSIGPTVSAVKRGMADTVIKFGNGSWIRPFSNSETAGHGKTLHMAVYDEAMEAVDDRREQGLSPAMVTNRDAQSLVFSTAGKASSLFLNRKIDLGRSYVEQGKTSGIAHFEWSAADDVDPADEEAWWDFMPALGNTIDPEVIRVERSKMPDGEFRRAYMNQKWVMDDRVIPESAWSAVLDSEVAPKGGLVLAADAKPDMSSAAIAVADSSGRVELIEHHDDSGWVVDRLEELSKRHNARVVIDKRGPLAWAADELAGRRVPLVEISTGEYIKYTGALFTNVMDKRIRVRPSDALNQAVAAARKRKVGDSWVWTRSDTDQDVCPLVAVTLALGVAFVTSTEQGIGVMLV